MTKRMFSWLVAIVAMMLLVPSASMAEEVGDEINYQVPIKDNYGETTWQTIGTFTVTSVSPREVALYKRKEGTEYDASKVFEGNLGSVYYYEDDGNMYIGSSNYDCEMAWRNTPYRGTDGKLHLYPIPSEVEGNDGNTYTVTGIGSGAIMFNEYWNPKEKAIIPNSITEIGRFAISSERYGGEADKHQVSLTIPASVKHIHDCFIYGREFGSTIHTIIFEHKDGNFQLDHSGKYLFARGFLRTRAIVPQEIIDQCKAGTRTDAFQQWYDTSHAAIDPSAPMDPGNEIYVDQDGYLLCYTLIETPEGNHEFAFFREEVIGKQNSTTLNEVIDYIRDANSGSPKGCAIAGDWTDDDTGEIRWITLTIPETITGYDGHSYKVTTIGRSAPFGMLHNYSKIILPSTLEHVGYNCGECLVKQFDFSKCTKLKKIGDRTFNGCNYLTSLSLPEGVEEIGAYAFSGIGTAYRYSSDGIDIHLPSTLKTIGDYAFKGSIRDVNFASLPNLRSIGEYAFTGMKPTSGVIEFAEGLESVNGFDHSTMSQLILPSTLKEIGLYAFGKCEALTELDIPASVETIGEQAFVDCKGLKKVTFPGLKKLGNGAFKNCTSLEEAPLPDCLEEIGSSAFMNCSLTGEFVFPKNIKSIGGYAFADNKFTGEITVPYSVTNDNSDVFDNNVGLTKVTILPRDKYKDKDYFHLFQGCTGVTDVYFMDADATLFYYNYDKQFGGPQNTKLHVSKKILERSKLEYGEGGINDGFRKWYLDNPEGLVLLEEAHSTTGVCNDLTLPLVNEYGEENGDTATVMFTIMDSEKREIGVFANRGDYEGGEDILYHGNGQDSYKWCVKKITGEGYIILPETMEMNDGHTYTLTMIGTAAFQGYYQYKSGWYYANYEGPTYEKLLGIVIPKTVRRIGDYAFSSNKNLSMVWFDDDSQLEHIGKYAFKSLDYPVVDFTTLPKLKIIDDGAFYYTEGYGETLNLGTTVETIGAEAFAYAQLKGTVELPASLKRLGAKAFYYNKDVARVNFNNLKPWALTWEGSGDKSENFAATTVVGCSQGIIDQCAEGTRQDQFMAYYPNQLVSIGSYVVIDLTGDGMTDGKDVMMLMDIISGKEPMSAAADLTGDGKVDIADIILLLKKMME